MTREEYRRRLATKRVGIAGSGGLGSNCACALARAGVGTIVVADFDTVSEANLDRQAFFRDQIGMFKVDALAATISRVDPAIRIFTRVARLDPESIVEIYAGCDVLVEAFDDARAKAMIVETALGAFPGMPVICASGIAGYGDSDRIRVYRSGMLCIVGDLQSEVGPDKPPMAPRVLVAAAMQADLVLEFLLGAAT